MGIADAQNTKKVLLLPPQLKDDGDFANNTYVYTAGWGYVEFLIIAGALDIAVGSTAEDAPLKVEECDTSDGTYTDVTDAEMAAVVGATDDNKISQIDVNLQDGTHKPYMRVNAPHAGDGTTGANMCIVAILSKPLTGPASAAERGLNEHVIV
ncbi:MAG: hypothetical protein OEV87_12085 [Phycisphaerae bacterium]|nr:hypothetical protein [Phycisphaerae bacterium]